MFWPLAIHAQIVPSLQDKPVIFDFCSLTRLLTKQEKASTDKAEGKGVSFAVALCEQYTHIDSKDCAEKELVLKEVKDNLKKKSRAEYGLAQALADLSSLSTRLGAEGGCTSQPQPHRTPLDDPYNVRKRPW